jgi:hypothetical protein
MTRRPRKSAFTSQPGNAERWVKSYRAQVQSQRERSAFTARLSIDVTTDLRGRIKITAFERGVTVADMLRDLLLKTFPRTKGGKR